ncbi:MAG: 3-isopropylmalate dehydratase small subunit [Candidatus Hydrothermarchaeota archaeon]
MIFEGKAHKFGDNINTDYIISGKYKFSTLDMKELAKHLMEDIDPNFYEKITPGDIIVGGKNFGCGSSREQAPLVIKHANISCVIAKSFARIFYRNGINIGLPLIECESVDEISDGDLITVNLEEGKIINRTKNREIKTKKLPEFMLRILREGGLAEHFKKHGGFNF